MGKDTVSTTVSSTDRQHHRSHRPRTSPFSVTARVRTPHSLVALTKARFVVDVAHLGSIKQCSPSLRPHCPDYRRRKLTFMLARGD